MIRSMTGFGEAEAATSAGRLTVELKTVNHRYLNINARLPNSLSRLEPELRDWLRGSFTRGHVNCTVRLERDAETGPAQTFRIDGERVNAYLEAFAELGREHGIPGTPDLALIARFNDIIVRDDVDVEGLEVDVDELRPVFDAAARQNVRMREEEGRRLHDDLEGRLGAIAGALGEIERAAPERLRAERDRLRAAIMELANGIAIDEARVTQEIAIIAERWDINEELVRFRSHIDLFRDLLSTDSEEAVGKRLSFLVQEMHREANTIGSKANNAAIAHRVVSIKEEVERLREQVENVE